MKHLTILLLASFLLVAFTPEGYSQTTKIKKQGDTTVFLDKSGNTTGSVTKSGNKMIFRDSRNNVVRPAERSRNTTAARKSDGKRVVTVTK
jgi:hypothetical protein